MGKGAGVNSRLFSTKGHFSCPSLSRLAITLFHGVNLSSARKAMAAIAFATRLPMNTASTPRVEIVNLMNTILSSHILSMPKMSVCRVLPSAMKTLWTFPKMAKKGTASV